MDAAREEAALAKQDVEALARQKKALEVDLEAAEEDSDGQFQDLQQAMAQSSGLDALNAETELKLAMTQKELAKAHSQLEKLELQLEKMYADHYTRVTEDAEQLRELRSELRQRPSPVQDAFRSWVLSKFLGVYLIRIEPAQWTTILESLDDEQVPGQGREPWTFVSSTTSIDEPLPTVEATCFAILAATPESPEYLPLAARLCSLLSAYTQAPRTLVDMALRTITGSALIKTSAELLFFVTAAARLAGLEKEMWPSIPPPHGWQHYSGAPVARGSGHDKVCQRRGAPGTLLQSRGGLPAAERGIYGGCVLCIGRVFPPDAARRQAYILYADTKGGVCGKRSADGG